MTGQKMKVAITGVSGFIGQKLAHYLLEKNHHVMGIARRETLSMPLNDKSIELKSCDIRNKEKLNQIMTGVDVIIHLAALFNRPEEPWEAYQSVNVDGTINVLEAAIRCDVKRVVHCSTGGVVAGGADMPYSELSPYSTPCWNAYETTKRRAEEAALLFCRENHLDLVVVRPTQPYGPGDTAKAKFYRLVKRGIIVDPGMVMKHPIFIDDLCRAFELAATHSDARGEIFNIGAAHPIYLKDLISIVANVLDVPFPKIVLPSSPVILASKIIETACNKFCIKPPISRRNMDFFTKSVSFDVSKSRNVLGFIAETDLRSGIQLTADWYRNNGLI